MAESAARIGGQPATVAEAVARAAAILGASRQAVVTGDLADIADVEAAVTLVQRIGGVLDHRDAGATLRGLDVLRRDGWIVTTPLQARARADAVLVLGPGILAAWPGFATRLDAPPALAPERSRQLLLLGCDAATKAALPIAEAIDMSETDLTITLGLASALLAGRPVRARDPRHAAAVHCATLLAEARYGVIAWSGALPGLAVEAAVALVETANRSTRCAGLALAGGAEAAAQACAWRTGFPLRVGFGRGHAEHDPWRFDAARLVASGEADAALWLGPEPPDWRLRLVALVPGAGACAAEVVIGVAEQDGVRYDPDLGTLAMRRGTAPGAVPAAASVLHQIVAALPC